MKLIQEYNYYRDNKIELNKKYSGRYILINGNKVIGDFNSEIEAYQVGKKQFGLGNFLIQLCSPEEIAPKVFNSRAML